MKSSLKPKIGFEPNDRQYLCMRKVIVQKESNYKIYFSENSFPKSCVILRQWLKGRKALIVTTPTVKAHYGDILLGMLKSARLDVVLKELHCTEVSKTMSKVEQVCAWIKKADLGRSGILVGLGGGVCLDIVTLSACLTRRGINYISIPTTLIGQVDAGIGIKGAINFGEAKSYLGCYYPPSEVLIARSFLQTLSQDRLLEGFAEIIKIAIIRDLKLMDFLETHSLALVESQFRKPATIANEVLKRSISKMIEELEVNFYENQTYERLVDFGHTFSPLLEVATKHKLSHGKAVSVDIALSTVLSGKLGLISSIHQKRILDLLKLLNLPVWVPELTPSLCRKALHMAELHRGGFPNLVLPTSIGKVFFLKNGGMIKDDMLDTGIQLLSEIYR